MRNTSRYYQIRDGRKLMAARIIGSLLIGCTDLGPSAVRNGRLSYNEAITETNNQQMLMAIIHNTKVKPERTAVAVQHRDGWFYIDDNDQATKGFFKLPGALWSVTMAESAAKRTATPVLTVPVSRWPSALCWSALHCRWCLLE